jgi:hypothetical protein
MFRNDMTHSPNHRMHLTAAALLSGGSRGLTTAAVADAERSAKTRAERARLKSCKDDAIIAQGGGLGGLALGYYHAAPHGAPEAT